MTGISALFITALVFMIALIVGTILSRAMEQYETRYAVDESRRLVEMFFFITPRQLILINICLMVVLSILGALIFNWFVALLLGILGTILPGVLIAKIREYRIKTFDRQLIDALSQMSAAFRAGLTMSQAMENIAKETTPPLSQEFGLTLKELKLGISMDEALENLANRVGSEELKLVVIASIISRQLGGNMAEMFDTISETIRERFRLEGKIKSQTAQGKLQGWIVALMPIILGFIFNMMRPDLMQPMLHSKFGYMLIGSIAVMELLGIFFIRRIVTINV